MSDQKVQEMNYQSNGDDLTSKYKLRMDSIAANIAAALSNVCDKTSLLNVNGHIPNLCLQTQTVATGKGLPSWESEKDISTSQSDHRVFTRNSIESFNSELHSLVSTSKDDIRLVPLDNAFSVLDVAIKSKEKLKCLHRTKLSIEQRLLSLLHDSNKCSYVVLLGKYKFRCHLAVLQAHSRYFLHFGDPDKLLTYLSMEHITPSAFKAVYNWMTNIKNKKEKKKGPICCSIVEIISAAQFLQIDELLDFCWGAMDAPQITESVAFALFREAIRFNIPDFLTIMLTRISRFFLTLVASEEFLDLEPPVVCKLLGMHNVGVNSEIEIFMSALRWLCHEWPNRRPYMLKLMHCVRFGLLSPLFLRFLQNKKHTQVLKCILQISEVQEMINKAFVYASTELFCCELNRRLQYLLPDCDLPEQRVWIYDSVCSYHHDSSCTHRQFFTYQQFLHYLQSLQEMGPHYWQRIPLLSDLRLSVGAAQYCSNNATQ